MAHVSDIRIPRRTLAPHAAVGRRIALAAALVIFVAVVVRISRDGYIDVNDDPIDLLDAVYYASVTVTTTGYGDISAVSPGARLGTILLITPARIMFLILVVSTTVEVLTEQSRILRAKQRWRQSVKDHTIICGYGETGHAAATDLVSRGVDPASIVVVDLSEDVVEDGTRRGFVGVVGDASDIEVLEQAGIASAEHIVVAPNRDDTAVLITLTARELNPKAHITVGVKEHQNLHLLRQGGANEVVDATAAIGRMLGLGSHDPGAATVLDDLLNAGEGIELVEVPATTNGEDAIPGGATLVGIIRDGQRIPQAEVAPENCRIGDRMVLLRDRS